MKSNKKSDTLWSDLIDTSEKQVQTTLIFTLLILSILLYIDFYSIFLSYLEDIKSFLLSLLGSYVGILGFTLGGIAIITALFSKDNIQMLYDNNLNNLFEKIINRYVLLTKIIGLCILIIFITYISLFSQLNPFNAIIFYIWSFVLFYLIIFSITYIISIVSITIRMYYIKNKMDTTMRYNRTILSDTNEIKISALLYYLSKEKFVNIDDYKKILEQLLSNSKYDNKDEIENYINEDFK